MFIGYVFFLSQISDEKGGWEKNGHAPHPENLPAGDLGDQTKVSLTSGPPHVDLMKSISN